MAGASPTASISTTIGVAFATLLVMGGILAGPSILDCSADTRGFGTCLRDRMASSGLLAPDGERIDRPAVSAEGPVTPEISVSDAVAVPIEATGWIDARAAEPARAPATTANLSAPVGTLDVAALPSAGGDTLGEVALAARGGKIDAEISDAVPAVPLQLTLLPRQGTLTAAGTTGPSTAPISSAVPMAPAGEVTVTGSIGAGPEAWVAELEAADPVPPAQPAPSSEPEAPAFDAPLVEAAIEAPVPAEPLPPIIRFDPQYPNVLVLPPPAEGDDSSFRTLQLN